MLTRILVGITLAMFVTNMVSMFFVVGDPAPGPTALTVATTLAVFVFTAIPVAAYYRCAKESEHKHRWWVAGPIITILTLSTVTAIFISLGTTQPAAVATYGWSDVILAALQTLIIGGPLLWLHSTRVSKLQTV